MPDGVMDTSRQWPSQWHEISTHHLLRYEFAYNQVQGRTLDAACGCGYGTMLLSVGPRDAVGVDSDAEAIRWARKFYQGPQFIHGRIEDSPWDGDFDSVVSLETIEHVSDPEPLLRALRKACKGTLVASVPNEELYPFNAENFRFDDSPHYRHYTPAEFDELLQRHGFKVRGRYNQKHKQEPEVREGVNGKFLIYVCE